MWVAGGKVGVALVERNVFLDVRRRRVERLGKLLKLRKLRERRVPLRERRARQREQPGRHERGLRTEQ